MDLSLKEIEVLDLDGMNAGVGLTWYNLKSSYFSSVKLAGSILYCTRGRQF
jgi:hypothetical protein